ncbi:MAG: choice-of-anchor L domain-containing protein [Bacteroidales bacterium]|nr:choice-of-anchor L domain-containing protein [Bacteroidales bacterium]
MNLKFVFLILLFFSFSNLKSQTFRIENHCQAKELVYNHLLSKNHNGIKIKNISYSGMNNALGLFQYKSKFNDLPASGIVLSSGKAKDAMGPNDGTASNENHAKGDIDLSAINNLKTFDSSILEFDFMSLTDSIRFVFQFASEEYPEYVKKGVSDIFGFLSKT